MHDQGIRSIHCKNKLLFLHCRARPIATGEKLTFFVLKINVLLPRPTINPLYLCRFNECCSIVPQKLVNNEGMHALWSLSAGFSCPLHAYVTGSMILVVETSGSKS